MTKFNPKKSLQSLLFATMMSVSVASFGAIEVHEFKSVEDEMRYKALIEELRCPKCQNQNLAGSDAPIAVDLKNQTYQMIQDGRSDTEIRQYMFDRYGDFISYKPPMRPSTWLLWFFPPILGVLMILGWIYKTKKSKAFTHDDDIKSLSRAEEDKLNAILAKHQNKEEKP